MKVAFVAPDFGSSLASAIGESTRLLGEALVARGHQVAVLALGEDRTLGDIRVVGLGGAPRTRPGQAWFRWRIRRTLLALARGPGLDRVEVPDYGGLLPRSLGPSLPHDVRVHQASTVLRAERGLPTAAWLRRAERGTLAGARRWLAADPAAADRARGAFGIEGGPPVVVLPVPVDVASPGEAPSPVAGRFVLFCGVRSRLKGADRFVRLAMALRPAHPGVSWVMAGSAGDDPVVVPAEPGLVDLGLRPRGEVFALMRDAVALVVPTRTEVQGMAVIEAAARGCPLVLPTGGPFGSWVDRDAATWVDRDDDAAWHAAVAAVLADPGGARSRAARLVDVTRQRFSPAAIAAAWET